MIRFSVSLLVVVLVAVFFMMGCGLNVSDDTKQLKLTGPVSLSVGAQPAEATYRAVGLDNDKIFTDRGKNYGTSPVLPYVWTIVFYNGNQPVKLLEELSGENFTVKFYRPGRYIVEVSLRATFESGSVVNSEIWTGQQIEVNVAQGAGYSSSIFTPGLIVSTSTGVAAFLSINIVLVRDWGVTTGYNPPDDKPTDSRIGNAILSFDEVRGQKNGQIIVTLSVEGLLDNLSISGVYYDKTLLTFKNISAIPGSGWEITSQGADISFIAINNNPQPGKIPSFKITFQSKDVAGISGITWGPAIFTCTYKGQKIALTTVDGIVRIE